MFNIGLLVPNSSMLSRFGRSFKLALEIGLGPHADKVLISSETGGTNSGPLSVRTGLERLIVNQEPDLIVAPLSVSVLPDIESLLVSEETPLLVATLGESRPTEASSSDTIRLCSHNLWEAAWLTGYRAVKDYGPDVAFVSAFHDCGFGFGEAVRLGAEAAGGRLVSTVVTRKKRATGSRTSRAQSFEDALAVPCDSLILNYSTSGVSDLHDMLGEFQESLPAMQALAMTVDESTITNEMALLNGMRSFIPRGYSRASSDVQDFSIEFAKLSKNRAPNVYSLLAYNIGRTISGVLDDVDNRNALFDGNSLFSLSDAFLPSKQHLVFDQRVLEIGASLAGGVNHITGEIELPVIESDNSYDDLAGGWFNPYLIA